MRCIPRRLSTLSMALVLSAPLGASEVNATDWLLNQVRIGEAEQRYDFVINALNRLMMIAPDNPEVVLARIRLLLHQADVDTAAQLTDRLCHTDSPACRRARGLMALSTPEGRQGLQQARLLASGGHDAQAVAAYDKLWKGAALPADLAAEYWRTVAGLPGQAPRAIAALRSVVQQNPYRVAAGETLVNLLFAQGEDASAYVLLTQMAAHATTRDRAATLWFARIKQMPPGAQSIAALQRYMQVFSRTPPALAWAAALLKQQRDRLADPEIRGRRRGLAQVQAGQDDQAQPLLQQALRRQSDDAEVLGALAQTYSRQGDRVRAIALLKRAMAADSDSDQQGKWQRLLKVNRYWLLIKQGDDAVTAQHYDQARQKYRQARALDAQDAYAPIGLGDVAAALGDTAGAAQQYRRALQLDPDNTGALNKLVGAYQQQSPDKAMAYLQQLPASQRRALQPVYQALQSAILQQQAATLIEQRDWAAALDKLKAAQQLTPDDIWLNYRLAGTLASAGEPSRGDALMMHMAGRFPRDADQAYAHALYLSSRDKPAQAQAALQRIPAPQQTEGMRALALRLQARQILDNANRLRDDGQEARAVAYLQRQSPSTAIDLTLADWAQARDDYGAARQGYQQVLLREPQNSDARLGMIETLVAQGDRQAVRDALQHRLPQVALEDLGTRRRLANAWAASGDPRQAQRIFDALLPQARQTPGMTGALILRDDARLAQQLRQPARARADLGAAMAVAGISDAPPLDNDTFTRQTRITVQDDWLTRSIRADSAGLYRQQEIRLTLEHDYWGSRGSGGYSDLKAHTTLLQADMPFYDGRLFARTDVVRMHVGRLSGGAYNDKFGSCYVTGCPEGERQRGIGTSLAAGWQNASWQMDIGTTPIGMQVVDVVGAIAYSGRWNHIGWTLDAHRRPVSSSLLALGGQRDPLSGTVWGGVRRNGVALSGSYDRGGPYGLWGSLSADYLDGLNVEHNRSIRWMGGYYYKFINEDNRQISIGLNNMLWHYDKDLSGYTLGQGGYYSPQRYVSFGIPLNYRQRTENRSWELGGSLSWSYAHTARQVRYPRQHLVNSEAVLDYDAVEDGRRSRGVGYTLRARVEQRLSSHWFVGAGIDIQQAKDYTPSHALIYVRYSAQGWQGDMDLPPHPLRPYADF